MFTAVTTVIFRTFHLPKPIPSPGNRDSSPPPGTTCDPPARIRPPRKSGHAAFCVWLPQPRVTPRGSSTLPRVSECPSFPRLSDTPLRGWPPSRVSPRQTLGWLLPLGCGDRHVCARGSGPGGGAVARPPCCPPPAVFAPAHPRQLLAFSGPVPAATCRRGAGTAVALACVLPRDSWPLEYHHWWNVYSSSLSSKGFLNVLPFLPFFL